MTEEKSMILSSASLNEEALIEKALEKMDNKCETKWN